MLPRADINSTRPVAAVEAARPAVSVADARQDVNQRLNQLVLGRTYAAHVLSRLNDGTFMVKLTDVAARMNLPASTQVGDILDLKFVATQPRPTFLQQASPQSAESSLSNAGRLIDNILRAAQKEGAPVGLVGKAPLVQSSAATPTQLASALKDALAFSGLFYESHVEQWAGGERPLAELMREPQAKKSNESLIAAALRSDTASGSVQSAAAATQSAAGAGDINAPETGQAGDMRDLPDEATASTQATRGSPDKASPSGASGSEDGALDTADSTGARMASAAKGEELDMPSRLTSGTHADTTSATKSAAGDQVTAAYVENAAPAETLDSESVRMISLQLDTLEQRRVAWQGELWPGQSMEWEVTEETPGNGVPGAEPSWQSVVRVELPNLGNVSAAIRLVGNRLQVQVRAAEDATASRLRTHGSELASALEAAGSPLDLLTIKRDESA